MTPRVRFGWLEGGFLILGLLLLGEWARTYLESRAFQSTESTRLDTALRAIETRSSAASLPPRMDARMSSPRMLATRLPGLLGRLEIPRLHLTAIVAEGVDARTLRHAVGHVAFTARPGSPGNCALAGHRDTFLRGLRGVRVNDRIRIVTLERAYDYRVEWSAVVEPQRVDVLDSTATRSLTLITCYPFVFVGHAPHRFVVRARQIEPVTGLQPIRVSGFPSPGLSAERR